MVMPLFRTEPEEDGLLAINIALLRRGDTDIGRSADKLKHIGQS